MESKNSCPSCSKSIDAETFLKFVFSDTNLSYSLAGHEVKSSIVSQIANSCVEGSCEISVLRNITCSQKLEKVLFFFSICEEREY